MEGISSNFKKSKNESFQKSKIQKWEPWFSKNQKFKSSKHQSLKTSKSANLRSETKTSVCFRACAVHHQFALGASKKNTLIMIKTKGLVLTWPGNTGVCCILSASSHTMQIEILMAKTQATEKKSTWDP